MTDFHVWIDPRVKAVQLASLIAYLRKNSWTDEGIVRQYFFRLRHPANQLSLVVPTPDESVADDLEQRIFEAVTQIAKIEGRYAGDVVTDLLALPVSETATSAVPTAPEKPDLLAQPVRQ